MNDLKVNGSGCPDPTAEAAIRHYDAEKKRLDDLIQHIHYVARLAGFTVEGRIVLKDKRSGKVWR